MNLSGLDVDRLQIVGYPDPALRAVCREVRDFGPRLEALASRMFELMRADRGIGLAAPQVGVRIRLFVCNTTGEPKDDMVCVNPTLSEFDGAAEAEEGCLCLPDVTVAIRRPLSVTLNAQDAMGRTFELRGHDLLARVWQHENDHLYGRLIIDYMSTQSRLTNARALKVLEAKYRRRSRRRIAARGQRR